jgi:hypothetical protein
MSPEEIITPEEAGVVVDVDTTVEEVVEDNNVAVAEEVVDTVEEAVA